MFRFKNGDVYDGEFQDDRISGMGKLTYKNNKVEEGYFEDAKMIIHKTKYLFDDYEG